jgi:hypothetical protein
MFIWTSTPIREQIRQARFPEGKMNHPMHKDALASCLIALALVTPCTAWAADPDTELDEVLVEGQRSKPELPSFEEYQEPLDWLARLVGTFVVEGNVDLHAQGKPEDLRKVSGRVECIGFGIAPGVLCELKIRWPDSSGPNGEEIPGGISTLDQAMMLFGSDLVATHLPQHYNLTSGPAETNYYPSHMPYRSEFQSMENSYPAGIAYMLLDSRGIGELTVGKMISPDTMESRAHCVAIPGDCDRLVRITAWPDMKLVDFMISLIIDGQEAVDYIFEMHRVPGRDSVIYGRKE